MAPTNTTPAVPNLRLHDGIGMPWVGFGKTPAQVILRWHLQLGNVVIPKSVTPQRIRENIEIFDFELSHREMAAIGDLDSGVRIGLEPTTFAGSAVLSVAGRVCFRAFGMLK